MGILKPQFFFEEPPLLLIGFELSDVVHRSLQYGTFVLPDIPNDVVIPEWIEEERRRNGL